jgi:hypothetical protein
VRGEGANADEEVKWVRAYASSAIITEGVGEVALARHFLCVVSGQKCFFLD